MEGNGERLDALCSLIADCPHSTPVWMDGGVVVLRNQNIRDGRLDLTQPSFTDEEHYQDRVRRAAPTAGDIVITREAPMGEVCMIPDGLKCCLGQRMVLLRPDLSRVVGRYLHYALQSRKVRNQIFWAEGTGSTVSNLRIPDLKALQIPIFDLEEQRAVAHILGTLDDKIELNRRMNETLEAIARTMFKSWFVDFDPVRAKMNGEPPASICRRLGLTPDLLALFPDRLVDSELGEIPEGWGIHGLDTLATLVTKSVSPGANGNEIFEHYSIPAFDAGAMPSYELGETIKSNKYVVMPDSVLVSKLNPETSRVWLPNVKSKNAVSSTEFMQFQPRFSFARSYLYLLMQSEGIQAEILRRVTGSTGSRQRAQPSQIAILPIAVPAQELAQAFDTQVKPMLGYALSNLEQSQALASLRDTLLPCLLSGELRVPDAETHREVV